MATYYSSTPPPENTLPPSTTLSPTTQSPTTQPPTTQYPVTTSSTQAPTIYESFDTTQTNVPVVDIQVVRGGGMPPIVNTQTTTPSPTLPPENTTTYSPKLTGPISRANTSAIVRPRNTPTDNELEARPQILTNQYTSGGEFVLTATGENYVGFYHIHPDKGPMVGALHVSTPHAYLTPQSSVTITAPDLPQVFGPSANAPSINDSIIRPNNNDSDGLVNPGATFDTDTPVTSESMSYVGNKSLSRGNNIMYRGIVSDNKGNLFLIPYAAPSIVKYNIDNNTTELIDLPTDSTGLQKYVGGVLASNGKIYTGSHAGNKGPLVIDTTGPDPIISEIDFKTNGLQARGPSIVDNIVYIPSYTGGKAWRLVDTTNDQPLPSIQWPEPPRTDEVYEKRPNWESESGMFYDTLFGSVAANNGKVYGMPFGASRINILDTVTNTVTWGKDSLTGNAPISQGAVSPYLLLNATSFNKYALGALAPNGNIYAHGRRARSILKIDTTTDTATEIPYPDEIIELMVDDLNTSSSITKKSASFSSVLGSDGKIYSVPWGIPYLLWIDPKDDSIGYSNISELLGAKTGALGRNSAWFTFGTSVGNSLYLSPGTADRILKIDVTTPTATFDAGVDDPSVKILDEYGAVVDPLTDPANPGTGQGDTGPSGGQGDTGPSGGQGDAGPSGSTPDPNGLPLFTCKTAGVEWRWRDADEKDPFQEDVGKYADQLADEIKAGIMPGEEIEGGAVRFNAFTGNAVLFTNNEVIIYPTVEGGGPATPDDPFKSHADYTRVTINGKDFNDAEGSTYYKFHNNLPINSPTIDLVEVNKGIIKSVSPRFVPNTEGRFLLFKVTIEIPEGYSNYPGTIECDLLGKSEEPPDFPGTGPNDGDGGTTDGGGDVIVDGGGDVIVDGGGNIIGGGPGPATGGPSTGGPPDVSTPPPDTSTTSTTPPPGTILICFDDNSNKENNTDGANPAWIRNKVVALGGSTGSSGNGPNDTAFDLPVGADVKSLVEVEIGKLVGFNPEKVPDTKGQRFPFKLLIEIPEGYSNLGYPIRSTGDDSIVIECTIEGYSSQSSKKLVCYHPEDEETYEDGALLIGANPTWNAAKIQALGIAPEDLYNFDEFGPRAQKWGGLSRVFNVPVGTIIEPLIDVKVGTLVKNSAIPVIVPNDPGNNIQVQIQIEVPEDFPRPPNNSIIDCTMELYPALSTTTTSTLPPPPPPPEGLPLDECLLECLTFTTPLPPSPGIPRAVPARLTIPFDRTTIPPVFGLGSSGIRIPTTPEPTPPPTTGTTVTTTTTIDPCPPECDIPSFKGVKKH